MNSLLSCYFPSRVIFIDDDIRILKSIRGVVDDNLATYKFFDDAYAALNYLHLPGNNQSFLFQSSQSLSEGQLDEIYQEIYNPHRFNEISMVIVDYDMPGINGLELCEKINSPYIRKILYTGVADEQLAINAFNKGIIDGYIRKHSPNNENTLNTFIQMNQIKYFSLLTEMLVGNFFKQILQQDPKSSAFYDAKFITFFNEFIEKNKIVEYYLNETVGGYVCLDFYGNPSVLFTYSEETFEQNQLHIQEVLEEQPAFLKENFPTLLKDLKENRLTICFPFSGEDLHPDPKLWEKYAYPVEKVEGNQLYYVAYAPTVDYIKASKIYSFEQYKKDLQIEEE